MRENRVPCRLCHALTWHVDAYCARCLPDGYGDEGITGSGELFGQAIDDAMREDRERMREEVDRP